MSVRIYNHSWHRVFILTKKRTNTEVCCSDLADEEINVGDSQARGAAAAEDQCKGFCRGFVDAAD